MSALKKLIALGVLVAVGGFILWLWQSPFFALHEIDAGLDARDPGLVERYADLERFLESSTAVLADLAREQVGVAGSDLGSALVGAMVGLVAGEVGKAVSAGGANALRRAIQDGTVRRGVGPFEVNQGMSAFGDFELFDRFAHVSLRGHCKSYDASLKVVLERRDTGAPFGLLHKYVLVGIDRDSARELARVCSAR